MAVAYLIGYRTEPGMAIAHREVMSEGLGHLQRHGLQAVLLDAIVGADAGTLAFSINFANHAEFVAGYQKVQADETFQQYFAQAATRATAHQVEATVWVDADPSFTPSADRPLGVLAATQWRARPGRAAAFAEHVGSGVPHLERLGATVRVLQTMYGTHPYTTAIVTSFHDLDGWAAHVDSLGSDAQWQEFWAGIAADPSADVVRSGVYLVDTGG
jgi:hypothetical protein